MTERKEPATGQENPAAEEDVITRLRHQLEEGELQTVEAQEVIPTTVKVEGRRFLQSLNLRPILITLLVLILLGDGFLLARRGGLPSFGGRGSEQAALADLPLPEPEVIPDEPPDETPLPPPPANVFPVPENETLLPPPPEPTPIPLPD